MIFKFRCFLTGLHNIVKVTRKKGDIDDPIRNVLLKTNKHKPTARVWNLSFLRELCGLSSFDRTGMG